MISLMFVFFWFIIIAKTNKIQQDDSNNNGNHKSDLIGKQKVTFDDPKGKQKQVRAV